MSRLENWRVEGCLIYDVYAPHVCTIMDCDGVTIANNTFPQNRPIIGRSTKAVVRNNIIGQAVTGAANMGDADYNLYTAGSKIGEHDLVGDPKFVNAPLFVLKSDSGKIAETTRTKFFVREARGRLAAGDIVEIYNTDGSARDAVARKVTAVGDGWVEVDPPIPNDVDPLFKTVFVYKWPAGQKNLVPDYHLQPGSPAIDSADSSVNRGPDRDGRKATDDPEVPNTGTGEVKCLDRGAFEFAPAK